MNDQTRTQGYVDTHYGRTLQATLQSRRLEETVEADVCVVGGGIAGISIAWELTARGLSVVVLEARQIAWGASGRNGGLLSGGFAASRKMIVARVGPKAADALEALSNEGVKTVLENTTTLNLVGVDPVKGVIAISRHANAEGTKAWRQEAERDEALVYLPPAEMHSLIKSERFHDGLLNNAGYHIHPLNYCVGLAAALEQRGGRVFENSAMVSMDLAGVEKIIRTAQGCVKAKHVVLAGGGYSGPEFGKLHRSIVPIATYVVATQGFVGRADDIMSTRAAVSDTRLSCDYFRVTPDGELLWGGGMSALFKQPRNLAALMKTRIVDVFPQLSNIDITLSWTGTMGYARHKMPYVQQIHPNVWVATAFGGHGLNTGPAIARVLAEAITEDGTRHELFRPFALCWNGNVLGQLSAEAIVATSNLSHRLRERWQAG